MSDSGWNRIIVEKPFGRDLPSAQKMAQDLGASFAEEQRRVPPPRSGNSVEKAAVLVGIGVQPVSIP